eukprot:scaffold11824_cov125-Isochrysis_galbana.AAC.2
MLLVVVLPLGALVAGHLALLSVRSEVEAVQRHPLVEPSIQTLVVHVCGMATGRKWDVEVGLVKAPAGKYAAL